MNEHNNDNWSFDKWADSYDSDVKSGTECFQRYDDVITTVIEAADIHAGSKVLDIGVGTGNLTLRCLNLDAEVLGLDPFKSMLEKAEVKLAGCPNVRLDWCEDPFLSMPCENASFDAIVSTYAFHHVLHKEKPAAVKELFRILKPGGVISIGDIMFESAQLETEGMKEFPWLDDEFYSRIDELREMFGIYKMELTCQQFTPISWVVHATKPKDS